MGVTGMHNWYVVQTKPRQESVAVENLERQGYTTYCPQMAQAKRRRQRWQKVSEPLFPRYLFVQLAEGVDNFAPIRSTIGVLNMVRFGEKPATIPQHVIETIQLQEQLFSCEVSSTPNWRAGDTVQLVDGPFAGLNGIFQKNNTEERIIILLDILGRENLITVNTNSVVPI